MGPGLGTSTRAGRQKEGIGTMRVETKNRKKARQNCGESAASRADSRSRSRSSGESERRKRELGCGSRGGLVPPCCGEGDPSTLTKRTGWTGGRFLTG